MFNEVVSDKAKTSLCFFKLSFAWDLWEITIHFSSVNYLLSPYEDEISWKYYTTISFSWEEISWVQIPWISSQRNQTTFSFIQVLLNQRKKSALDLSPSIRFIVHALWTIFHKIFRFMKSPLLPDPLDPNSFLKTSAQNWYPINKKREVLQGTDPIIETIKVQELTMSLAPVLINPCFTCQKI